MLPHTVLEDITVAVADVVREGIGSSDCETLRDGALAQPVNAITSFAYVLVGLAVVLEGRRRARLDAATIVFAVCLAGVGIGSVLFHGPQPPGSRLAHDLPITLTVLFIVVHDVWLVRRREHGALTAFGVAALTATAVSVISLDAGMAVTGVGIGAIAVLELVIVRRRLRPIETSQQRRAYAIVIGITAIAATTYALGRTGSPTCEPDSFVQLHAVWHLLSALLFGTWWWLAFDLPDDDTEVERRVAGSTLVDQG